MSKFEKLDWYDAPKYYDMIFDTDTKLEADFIEQAIQMYGRVNSKTLLEPACGSGRLMLELAERGFNVTGFDLSEAMLKYASTKTKSVKKQINLLHADMTSFKLLRKVDAAYSLVSTFKYLLDEESAASHLQRVADSLKKGGIFILGFHITDSNQRSETHERWTAQDKDCSVTCNIHSWAPDFKARTERVRSRLKIIEAGAEKRMETEWLFRTYSNKQAQALLAKISDFELLIIHDFTYDADVIHDWNDNQLDRLLILRKR